MLTSESIKSINEALVKFHHEMPPIKKDSTNPFFKSKYADLSSIIKATNPYLNKNGLAILQFPEGEYGLTTRLIHVSGEWMESTYFMKPIKATPQDAGSAITYQRRYAIGAILNLDIDDDDDGNNASGKGKQETNGQAQSAPPADDKPWLNENSEPYRKALEYLNKGNNIKDIEKKYKISKKVRESLLGSVELQTA